MTNKFNFKMSLEKIKSIHKLAKPLEGIEYPNKISGIKVIYKTGKVIVKGNYSPKPYPYSKIEDRLPKKVELFQCNSKGEIGKFVQNSPTVEKLIQEFQNLLENAHK